MKLDLESIELLLSKFGFRKFCTTFLNDGAVLITFRNRTVPESELRLLHLFGFTVKYKGGWYVVSIKFAIYD